MNLGSNLRESEQFFLPSLSPLLVFFSPYSPLPSETPDIQATQLISEISVQRQNNQSEE